jgi:hypothetical protein
MVYRMAVLSAILLAGAACTIPACAAGQKARPPTAAPRAQLPKITRKVTFQGSCKGTISDSDGVPAITASTLPSEQFALMQRLGADGKHLTLDGATGLVWRHQPLSCDSIMVIESDDYKGHTTIVFLNAAKKAILGFEGPIAVAGGMQGAPTTVAAQFVLLPDGRTSGPMQPAIQGPNCQAFSTQPHYPAQKSLSGDAVTQNQQRAKEEGELLARAEASWASRLTTITCSARLRNPADGHLTNVNVEFDVPQPPSQFYTVPKLHP